MDLDVVAVACLAGFAAVLWWFKWSWPPKAGWSLPPELCDARLVYAERLFCWPGPVTITAKVDRVYRNATDNLVLVELKTRATNRVYWSDVIELSAQRLALMGQTGAAVADYAYVLIERPDGSRSGCHRVRLMASRNVMALATRRQELLLGEAEPQPACFRGMCRKCVFVRFCDSPWRSLRKPPARP